MKNNSKKILVIFCIIFSVFLHSCKSSDEKKDLEIWENLTDYSLVEGLWESDSSMIEYPFYKNDEKCFVFYSQLSDDTQLWKEHAEKLNTDVEDLIAKKNSMLFYIYGTVYPIGSDNGCETGILLYCDDRIQSRKVWIVPESVVRNNEGYLQVSNKGRLKEEGVFHFFTESRGFEDITSDIVFYTRSEDEK